MTPEWVGHRIGGVSAHQSEIDPRVLALHRYFMWSTLLKGHFEEVLARFTARGEDFSLNSDDGAVGVAYMSYWYASLWVVIEGWRTLDLHDDEVDRLLDAPSTEKLKLYRHNVFHFHENYWNEPLVLPLLRDSDTVTWVRELSSALGRSLLEKLGYDVGQVASAAS